MKIFMNKGINMVLGTVMCLLLIGCGSSYSVPQDAVANGKNVVLYPDYTDVTVPPNIAPLNFIVKAEADEYVVQVKAGGKELMVSGGSDDGVVQFDSTEWRNALRDNRGKVLNVTVYELSDGQWTSSTAS